MTTTRTRRRAVRIALATAIACAGALAGAHAASAHNSFEPDTVAPGADVELTLVVENENSSRAIVAVEIRFPERYGVIALPTVDGWTSTPVEGAVGADAIGIRWTRPNGPAGEDPRLPLTIGPLPDRTGQLQFKVIQTYDDGRIDRWIEDWPEGQPEPAKPGPLLQLAPGGAGTVRTTTTITSAAPATTVAPTTTPSPSVSAVSTTEATASSTAATTTSPTTAPSAAPDDGEGGSNVAIAVAAIVLGVALAALVVVVLARRRSSAS